MLRREGGESITFLNNKKNKSDETLQKKRLNIIIPQYDEKLKCFLGIYS